MIWSLNQIMPRASNTAERRQQIAQAFLKVMAHRGYDGTAIAEVARRAKLAPGLVHYHFKNKLEILLAATRELLAEHRRLLDGALAAAAAAAAATSPAAAPRDSRGPRAPKGRSAKPPARVSRADLGAPPSELVAFLDVHLGLGAHSNPDALAFWVQLGGVAQQQREVLSELRSALTATAELLTDIVRRGVAAGDFQCEDPAAAAAALLSTIEGYFVLATNARAIVPPGSAAPSAVRMAEGLLRCALPPLPIADRGAAAPRSPTRARSAHD